MKTCTKCKQSLPLDQFCKDKARKDGKNPHCKPCVSKYRRKRAATYAERLASAPSKRPCTQCGTVKRLADFHVTRAGKYGRTPACKACISASDAARYRKDPEKRCAVANVWKEKNKDRYNKSIRAWHARNKDYAIEYAKARQREKMRTDPLFVLSMRCRNRLGDALRRKGYEKKTKTMETIGCDWETLADHIESLFRPGMTWDNRADWHLDHIIPLASADTEEELLALCHYSNIQPLWATHNIKKGAKLDYEPSS